MRVWASDHFEVPLPEGHPFPMPKYRALRELLLAEGVVSVTRSEEAPREWLDGAHDPSYVARVLSWDLSAEEVRRLGMPLTPELVARARAAVFGTVRAAQAALEDGVAGNLAGGTHHAFRDRGEGFCVFNDAAIAARALQVEAGLQRILIVDCDVHQGNGTAAIFAGDPSVFTFSIHGARNFPFAKERSDLDVELADGTGDEEYLWHLERGLDEALERSQPQFAFYLAGADPFEGDRLGRLKLTRAGLRRRDEWVLRTLRGRGLPVAIAMAGGYAHDIADSVEIHANTLRVARDLDKE